MHVSVLLLIANSSLENSWNSSVQPGDWSPCFQCHLLLLNCGAAFHDIRRHYSGFL